MQQLSLDEFVHKKAKAFDSAVLATPQIDQFCSSTNWIIPADDTLTPGREPWLFQDDSGYVALMSTRHSQGWTYLAPLEAAWCLASPLISSDSATFAGQFAKLCRKYEFEWNMIIISGISPSSSIFESLVTLLSKRYTLKIGPATTRHLMDFSQGVDGFLARRSPNFRRSLNRANRITQAEGITFEKVHLNEVNRSNELYRRILNIEEYSWKGKQGVGINTGSMCEFYKLINQRLIARGAQRTIFAQYDGKDIGYILGGIFGDTYRGLQFSYNDNYKKFSLGNLLQFEQIKELCEQGYVTYDLGTDVEYKVRWADSTFSTVMLLVYQ